MAGEFLGQDQHKETSKQDSKSDTTNTDGYQTDVPDVKADGVKKLGNEEFPVFKVSHDEFYGNMQPSRRRQRYKSGTPVHQYIQKTRNSGRPFYVRTVDANGKEYERKIR